jgi:hypothetical protein
MRLVAKDLAAVKIALAAQDAKKAKAQLAKLDKVATGHLGAIAHLLGWKPPNLKTLPKDLFALRIP